MPPDRFIERTACGPHGRVDRELRDAPRDALVRYDKWNDIVAIVGGCEEARAGLSVSNDAPTPG